jgi:Cu/Ag efflux protein CusF/cytochrome c5
VKHYLALAAVTAGLALTSQPALPHAQATTTVQFDREIVRILDNHCVMCHMEKGPAFPLVTYEQTYAARWKIRQSALDRHMAPWAAVPGYGDFANDNGLTQREIDFLVSWAESYGPRNNGQVYRSLAVPGASTKAIQARTDFDPWELGKPDIVLRIPAGAIVDPKLKSDRWLRGLEYKPADRRLVRAVSFAIQESDQWVGTWTPWQGFVSLPDGLAVRLPAGSHIVAKFLGSKERVTDAGSLALYYADKPSPRAVSTFVLDSKPINLTQDTNLLALEPVLRPGIRSIEVSARLPTGATQVLLFAKDIPLDWPTPYVYRRAVPLPKGTELKVIQHYAADGAAPAPVTFSAYEGTPLAVEPPQPPDAPLTTRRFELTGTVKSVDAANGRLVVEHGAIPGLMGAMTMSYSVGQREDLRAISAGEQIHADVVVSETGSHLENIKPTSRPR